MLDAEQLSRIQATHRGFGYQHMYAVACLLSMQSTHTESVIIESDEDIELVRPSARIYAQVKTRDRVLRFSDLKGLLPRFAALRTAHAEGSRMGVPLFAVVSSSPPGPDLRARLASPDWPSDVSMLWPGGPKPNAALQLPQPWVDLGAAFEGCVSLASFVPFPTLTPATLVFKLAGLAQYLATGHAGQAATAAQVQEFFEQLVIQLHDLPEPPVDYRRQADEPDLYTADRVLLVTGISGCGKTAWASYTATRHPLPVAYFDVDELPESALAKALARELVARFMGDGSTRQGGAAIPQASGMELLALVSRQLGEAGLTVTVVLDNVHRVPGPTLRRLVEAGTGLRFVLLGQPWPGQAVLEAHLAIGSVTLGGWSLDDVAAVFAAAGSPIQAAAGRRVLGLTGGLPLYVKAAARLATEAYAGDNTRFLDDTERRLALAPTAQEVLLAEAFEQLSPAARVAAALLDLSDVPLANDEAVELVSAGNEAPAMAAAAIRQLIEAGVAQLFRGGNVKLHDAFRLLARDSRATLPPRVVDAAREALVVLLQRTMSARWTVGRYGLWARLLPQTGRLTTLIDIATDEQFHQIGDPAQVKAVLEAATASNALNHQDRFWALDALVLWEYTEDDHSRLGDLVYQMAALAGPAPDRRMAAALAMKQMLVAALRGDRDATDTAYAVATGSTRERPAFRRILQYNYAMALYRLGADEAAVSAVLELRREYLDQLGLRAGDVFGTNVAEILVAVPDRPHRDEDLRHIGDCLDLLAMALKRLGQPAAAGLAYVHAMKFYTAASAWRSSVRAGQDAVDELIALADLESARHICENQLLPTVSHYELSDLLVPVRSQYAVLLAWCGDVDQAREEMARLNAYQVNELGRLELANQQALIERIARHSLLADPPHSSSS